MTSITVLSSLLRQKAIDCIRDMALNPNAGPELITALNDHIIDFFAVINKVRNLPDLDVHQRGQLDQMRTTMMDVCAQVFPNMVLVVEDAPTPVARRLTLTYIYTVLLMGFDFLANDLLNADPIEEFNFRNPLLGLRTALRQLNDGMTTLRVELPVLEVNGGPDPQH